MPSAGTMEALRAEKHKVHEAKEDLVITWVLSHSIILGRWKSLPLETQESVDFRSNPQD